MSSAQMNHLIESFHFRIFFLYFGYFFLSLSAVGSPSSCFGCSSPGLRATRRTAIDTAPLCGERCSEMGAADGFTCVLLVCPRSIDGPAAAPLPSAAGPACRNANRFTPPAAADRCGREYCIRPYRVVAVDLISDGRVGL